jgi:acyl carrier protein
MSDYNYVETTVKEILAKQLTMDVGKINVGSRLVEDLGIDSFGSVEVAFELEEKFNLKIPDAALYEAKTVKNIVDYIASQKEGK